MRKIATGILSLLIVLLTFIVGCGNYQLTTETTRYNIYTGESVQLEYTFTKNGKLADIKDLKFVSEDTSIATVDSMGKVTGIASGWVNIIATFGKLKIEFSVRVMYSALKLEINATSYGMLVGETSQVSVTAIESSVTVVNPDLSYEMDDPSIATVSKNGLISACKLGKTILKIKWRTEEKTIPVCVYESATKANVLSFDEEYVNLFGRVYLENNALCTTQTSSGIEFVFKGTTLKANIQASYNTPYINCFIDEQETSTRIKLSSGTKEYVLADGLNDGYHKARIVKTSEINEGKIAFKDFSAQDFAKVHQLNDINIEFIGDSITSGYGALGTSADNRNMDNSDSSCSYAYKTANLLNASFSVIARQGICVGVSFNTADTMLDLYKKTCYNIPSATSIYSKPFDVVVINLGTNDAEYLKKNPTQGQQFTEDYKSLLKLVRENNPNAYIVCLYGVMGKVSVVNSGIANAVSQMEDTKIVYNPIPMDKYDCFGPVGHPTQFDNSRIASDVAQYLRALLNA